MAPAFGYALREHEGLHLDLAVSAIEIPFEQADQPLRTERYLGDAHFKYTSLHSSKLSPGSADAPSRRYLDAIREVAMENGARAISDHLGFTRDCHDGTELGNIAPIPFTLGALEATCRNVELIQRHFQPFPFYLENIAYLFQFDGELDEVEFLTRVFSRTGCGWLLDVTNVYANSVNFRFDPYDFIGRIMPDAAQVQMHLAGGFHSSATGVYSPSDRHPVPSEVWELYRFALAQAGPKLEAVFIERNPSTLDESVWGDDVRHAGDLAMQVGQEQAAFQRAG
jgi:uncharacterized protein